MRVQAGETLRALPQAVPGRRRRAYFGFAAVGLIAVVGLPSVKFLSQLHTYTTQVGEQRVLQLPDGSTVQLNTQSRVKIDFSTSKRQIWLSRGEALFSVSRDPRRP